MQGQGLVQLIPPNYIYTVAGVLLSGLLALLGLLLKELTRQRTNCFATQAKQGEKVIELLERLNESMSYLKGKLDSL